MSGKEKNNSVTTGKLQPVQDLVARDILKRKELGIKKYGRPVTIHNERRPDVDLYEELLDAAVYAKQLTEEFNYLLDILLEVISDACGKLDGGWIIVDSMAMTSYADAIKLLENYGKLEIIQHYGKYFVVGKIRKEGKNNEK